MKTERISVAARIQHFEMKGKFISKDSSETDFQTVIPMRPTELDDILEESSLEEEEEEDSDTGISEYTAGRKDGRSSSSNSEDLQDKDEVKGGQAGQGVSHKLSLDSGFSDSSEYQHQRKEEEKRKLKSAVVHETHALNNSNKMHHVSKVYFYSVSDILQEPAAKEMLGEPDSNNNNSSNNPSGSSPSTPRISAPASELDYLDIMLENSPHLDTFQRGARARSGPVKQRPIRSTTPTQTFPITNGSLYSDLSLNRKVSEGQRAKRRLERDSFNVTSCSLQSTSDLDSFDNPLDASNLSSNTSYSPTSSCSSSLSPSLYSSEQSRSPTSPSSSLYNSLLLDVYDLSSTHNSIPDIQSGYGIRVPDIGSVSSWLEELRNVHESECTIMLQSKPVRRREDRLDREDVSTVRDRIKIIQDRAHTVSSVFSNLCREVSEPNRTKQLPYIHALIHQINLFFLECESQDYTVGDLSHFPGFKARDATSTLSVSRLKTEQTALMSVCEEVRTGTGLDKAELVQRVKLIGSLFSKVVELILSLHVAGCVAKISHCADINGGGLSVESTLSIITSLALDGNNLCRLLVAHGALSSILEYCADSHPVSVRISALRTLGSICCILEGIQELSRLAGQNTVVAILADQTKGEGERREAAGVLAQVTSPWIEGNHPFPGIDGFLSNIVYSLKDLLKKTSSKETFLLCSAALANLSSLVPSSLLLVTSSSILSVLLDHSAADSSSVYIQDQIVTILANLAKLPAARAQMIHSEALRLLVRILSTVCKDRNDAALRAATQRTVSKSAIALARLCVDPVSADSVVCMGGLDKLLELVRRGAENQTLQISAMAAIKTITIYCSASISLDLEEEIGKNCGFYTTEKPISSLESFV